MYIHNSKENKNKGRLIEREFELRFKDRIVRKATQVEDIFRHFDFVMSAKDGTEKKVDVKSGNKDENVLRVEIVNRMGEEGWLYGESDYIVYSQENDWFFVETKDLVKMVKDKLFSMEGHFNSPYRKWYQEGSKAILTFVPAEDVTIHKVKRNGTE